MISKIAQLVIAPLEFYSWLACHHPMGISWLVAPSHANKAND